MSSIASFETLKNLIYYKEVAEIKSFSKLMQKKIMEQGKAFFDVWMYEVSDEIQSLALAFGQRYMLEGAIKTLNDTEGPRIKALLTATIRLHMLHLVRSNITWYLMNGAVSDLAAAALDDEFDQAVKDYVPFMNTAVQGLGLIETPSRVGPIARDYVAFNSQPDSENFASAGDIFDFK